MKSVGLNEAKPKRLNGVVSPEVSQESETVAQLETERAAAARVTEKKKYMVNFIKQENERLESEVALQERTVVAVNLRVKPGVVDLHRMRQLRKDENSRDTRARR